MGIVPLAALSEVTITGFSSKGNLRYPKNTWTLVVTTTPENGGSTSVRGTQTIPVGQSMTVSATPNQGYHFVSWMVGDVFAASNPITVGPYPHGTVHTLTASFILDNGGTSQTGVLKGIGEDYLMWTDNPNCWYDARVYYGTAHVNTAAKIQEHGFNVVRLCIGIPSGGLTHHSAYDANKLDQVLNIVYGAGAQGILSIFNVEDPTWFFGTEEWVNLCRNWAITYGNDPRVKGIEIFNEPCAGGGPQMPTGGNVNYAVVNDAVLRAYNAIRAVDSDMLIIYPFNWWEPPPIVPTELLNDPHVLITYHCWDFGSASENSERMDQFLAFLDAYGTKVWLGEIGTSESNSAYIAGFLEVCKERGIGYILHMYKDCYDTMDVAVNQVGW